MNQTPAIGARVALAKVGPFRSKGLLDRAGFVVGFDFKANRVQIQMDGQPRVVNVVPLAAISDTETQKLIWRDYRDRLRSTGLAHNGISRRDFFAGYEAGKAA